jgi:hypothetical protein
MTSDYKMLLHIKWYVVITCFHHVIYVSQNLASSVKPLLNEIGLGVKTFEYFVMPPISEHEKLIWCKYPFMNIPFETKNLYHWTSNAIASSVKFRKVKIIYIYWPTLENTPLNVDDSNDITPLMSQTASAIESATPFCWIMRYAGSWFSCLS